MLSSTQCYVLHALQHTMLRAACSPAHNATCCMLSSTQCYVLCKRPAEGCAPQRLIIGGDIDKPPSGEGAGDNGSSGAGDDGSSGAGAALHAAGGGIGAASSVAAGARARPRSVRANPGAVARAMRPGEGSEGDETCPVSTEGWTRRVHFVRKGGGGGSALAAERAARAPPRRLTRGGWGRIAGTPAGARDPRDPRRRRERASCRRRRERASCGRDGVRVQCRVAERRRVRGSWQHRRARKWSPGLGAAAAARLGAPEGRAPERGPLGAVRPGHRARRGRRG